MYGAPMGQAKRLRAEIAANVNSLVRTKIIETVTRMFPADVVSAPRRSVPHLYGWCCIFSK